MRKRSSMRSAWQVLSARCDDCVADQQIPRRHPVSNAFSYFTKPRRINGSSSTHGCLPSESIQKATMCYGLTQITIVVQRWYVAQP